MRQRIFPKQRAVRESVSSLFVPASCCGVGVEDSSVPDAGGSAGTGGTGGGVAVIPDRPPLELDKLPPYHDVAPSPGECYYETLAVRRFSCICVRAVEKDR